MTPGYRSSTKTEHTVTIQPYQLIEMLKKCYPSLEIPTDQRLRMKMEVGAPLNITWET